MVDYDFKILQPSEFECFTRDLLQAHNHLLIESFANGRDKGIDLRFAYDKRKSCIVQCKRYKEWNELKLALKNEVEKVKTLNPERYILATSVDLTAKNKDDIKDLFSPYIKDTATDILGRSDLNNLLGLYPNIEKQYYKLWLGSTNVLEEILHKNIINWSEFEREEILSVISKYVANKSFDNAVNIIKSNNYVIISGIPGIGKTTLARMLVYHLLAHGYEEFVYVVDDLDKACSLYDSEKKQVFFFDDFLGANSFICQGVSFENKLISFINRVKKSKNSIFIMTTREYILSEAKCHYEKLDLNNIEIAKCTIDLANYTKSVRAQILYNHLAEAVLPNTHIAALLDNKKYKKLIEHKNFNPRVIEGLVKQRIWEGVTPEEFVRKTLDFFDRPLSVWLKAFQNLNSIQRYALLVFITMGNDVSYDEWQAAFKHFCKTTQGELGIFYDDTTWRLAVKVLLDCFIKQDTKSSLNLLQPYNPSVMDFGADYIRGNGNTKNLLLQSVLYPEQLTTLFTDSINYSHPLGWQVEIGQELYPVLLELRKNIWKMKDRPFLIHRYDTDFCLDFQRSFPVFSRANERLLESQYHVEELFDTHMSIDRRLEIMKILNWSLMIVRPENVIKKMIDYEILNVEEWQDLSETVKYLNLDSLLFNEEFYNTMTEQICQEIDSIDSIVLLEDEEYYIHRIKEVADEWNEDACMSCILSRSDFLEAKANDVDHDDYEDWTDYSYEKEDNQIHEMFTSLYRFS